jgi:hemerythrin-like domain-containing protein
MLEHLQWEHHRLNRQLTEIRHQLAQLDHSDDPPRALAILAGRLEAFLKTLRRHFAEEEEQSGIVEEACAACPERTPELRGAAAEHDQLAEALQRLVARMKRQTAPTAELRQELDLFAGRLNAHEGAENRLFEAALGAT